jgi:tRNA pseudouridine38-40 synthase
MPTWKLTLEYEGTRYRGWQAQKNTDRTVQGVLQRAAVELFGGEVTVGGAGRTDAGVHALAQVAHLRAKKLLLERPIEYGLNDRLPFDVNILEVAAAPPTFHARHDAISRTYFYRISLRRTAFDKRLVWWIKDRLDAAAMVRAATLFEGRHDFAAFCENAEGQDSTAVEVESSQVVATGTEIHYRITASHFLWKMVRRIVGTLVEVGRGTLDEKKVGDLLRTKTAGPAQWTAPPSGLFLERVRYPDGPRGRPSRRNARRALIGRESGARGSEQVGGLDRPAKGGPPEAGQLRNVLVDRDPPVDRDR